MMKNKIIIFGLFIAMFFFVSNVHADLYLNSKVGSIYFNTTGIARASIGPGGNFTVNTSVFFVNTDLGRVGIGTTTPGYKLDVSGDGRFNGGSLYLAGASGETATQLYSYNNANSLWLLQATSPELILSDGVNFDRGITLRYTPGTTGTSSGQLIIGQDNKNNASYTHGITSLYTNGTERVRINGAGNVGIGTTTPSNLLDVNGTISSFNGTGSEFRLGYSYSRIATLDSGGAFGGGYNFNWNDASPKHDSTGTLAGYGYSTTGNVYLYSDNSQTAGTAVTPRLTVNSSGNVGIGTTTPSNKLDVRGVINASGDIYFNNGTAVGSGNLSGGGTAGYIPQWASGSTLNNSNIFQGSGGQIGINISAPVYTLHVKGGAFVDTLTNTLPFIVARSYKSSNWEEIRIGVDDAIGTFHYMNDETANRIIFRMNNTDLESGGGASANVNDVLTIAGDLAGGKVGIRNSAPLYSLDVVGNFSTSLGAFLATSSGNVGIGTTSPTQKLHVSGGVNISSGTPNLYLWDTDSSAISTRLVTDTNIFRIQDSSTLTNIFNVNLSSGFVGIGTTTPSNKLDVRGDINASGNIYFNNGTLVGLGNLSGGGTAGYIPQWSGTSGLNNSPIYTSGGLVGIGAVTSSDSILYIEHVQNNASQITLKNNRQDLGNVPIFDIAGRNSGTDVAKVRFYRGGGSSSGYLTFETKKNNSDSLAEVMRLDGDGNIGIGTTTPSNKLDVRGVINASSDIYFNNGTKVGLGNLSGGGTAGYLAQFSGTSGLNNSIIFQNGSSVGVGTQASSAKFHVYKSGSTTSNIAWFQGDTGGVNNDNRTQIQIGPFFNSSENSAVIGHFFATGGTGDYAYFGTYDYETSIVTKAGNVGIGTITPSNKLDVRGDINASGNIYFNNGTAVGSGNLSGGGTAGYLAQWSGTSGLNNSPIYTSGGKVGIGTITPTTTLDIWGNGGSWTGNTLHSVIIDQNTLNINNGGMIGLGGRYDGSSSTYWAGIKGGKETNTSGEYGGYLALYSRANASDPLEKMRITGAGNVGIGTVTPTHKLNVVGDVNVTGSLYSNITYLGTGAGTKGGEDNLIRPLSTSSWLNVKGGSGRAKATFGNDVVEIVAGNSGSWIDFRYGASSSTNMGSSAMFINGSDGNVGIGTTTPSNKLDVRGVINASGDIYFNNGTKVGLGNLSGGGTAGYIPQWSGTSGLNNSPIYTSGGNFSIGSIDPKDALEFYGPFKNIRFNNPTSAGTGGRTGGNYLRWIIEDSTIESARIGFEAGPDLFNISTMGGAFPITLSTNSVERMRVTGAGLVGIGTPAPISLLHVNGTAGGFTVDVAGSMPTLNTTMGKNMTITSAGGSVIIKLG